jgi:hypothetical protein
MYKIGCLFLDAAVRRHCYVIKTYASERVLRKGNIFSVYTKKTYWGWRYSSMDSSNLSIRGRRRSASRRGHFSILERPVNLQCIEGWGNPSARMSDSEKKRSCTSRESKHVFSVVQSVAGSVYRLSYSGPDTY